MTQGPSWAVDEVVACYGVPVRLRADTRAAFAELVGRLPPSWAPSPRRRAVKTYGLATRRRGGAVYDQDGVEQYADRNLDRVLTWFETTVRLHVAERTPLRTFVHAAAVAWRGHAIVLPARPEDGKTTLTAALVRAGATYLSDEFAPIDDRGRVHPYPKALWVASRGPSLPVRVAVEELGGVQGRRPLPVGLVVFTRFGAMRWRPQPVSPGRAILEILKHTVSAQQYPERTLQRLERVVASAVVLKGARGEAEETAPRLLARLASELDRRPS